MHPIMIPSSEIEQQSEAWHDFRSKGIGSSEVSSIMGLNKHKSLRKLWLEKTGQSEDKFEDNEYTSYGNHKESFALHEYCWQYNVDGFEPCLFIHPKYSFMRASVDAYHMGFNYCLEIKSPYFEKNLKDAAEGKIPRKYWAQVQWIMMVSMTKMIKLIHYDGHQNIWVKDVFADHQYQERMRRYVIWFWHLVENKIDPKRRKLKHLRIDNVDVTDV